MILVDENKNRLQVEVEDTEGKLEESKNWLHPSLENRQESVMTRIVIGGDIDFPVPATTPHTEDAGESADEDADDSESFITVDSEEDSDTLAGVSDGEEAPGSESFCVNPYFR
jgi:hypothetical protein